MNEKNYIPTEFKMYLDGKEVMNFEELAVLYIVEENSSNADLLLKRFESWSSTITLTDPQVKRFRRIMRRLFWKTRFKNGGTR